MDHPYKNFRLLIAWLAVNLVALLGFCAVVGLVTYESQFKKYKPESECLIRKAHLKPLFWIFLLATCKFMSRRDLMFITYSK